MTATTLPRHNDNDNVRRWVRQGRGDDKDNKDNKDTMVTPPRLGGFILFYFILYKF